MAMCVLIPKRFDPVTAASVASVRLPSLLPMKAQKHELKLKFEL